MGRKPCVDLPGKEVAGHAGRHHGNVSETCRRHGIAPNLYYRWRDEAEQRAQTTLGGTNGAAADTKSCDWLGD